MSIFQIWLAVGAATVAILCWNLERSWFWISAGAASFVASTAWARYGLPLPPLFTAMCDASVCLLIYGLARQQWELHLFRIFQASVMVSLAFFVAYFGGLSPGSNYAYVAILEILNWSALALILGTGIMQRIADHGSAGHAPANHRSGWARQALFAPRETHPWWKK